MTSYVLPEVELIRFLYNNTLDLIKLIHVSLSIVIMDISVLSDSSLINPYKIPRIVLTVEEV